MLTCSNCGRESPDGFLFCPQCATALAPATAPEESRRVVTVVFADVTGSTSLGEHLDAEALRDVMGRYFDRMRTVIERHGGTVEKFIGDAVMAVFGIPQLHDDDAVRAVRAAHEMRESLVALNKELERDRGVSIAARTGVMTGEVVAGDPAGGQRLVTGDAVNVAARLQQAAAPGEVLVGEPTLALVRDAVIVEPAGPVDAKGKAEPVTAWRLVDVAPLGEGFVRRLDSPMVGRGGELSALEQAFERARRDHTCQLFTVLGSAGVGKSRLIAELVTRVEGSAVVLTGRCLPYGEGITFYPVAQVVSQAIARTGANSSDPRAFETLLGDTDEARLISERASEIFEEAGGVTSAEEVFWAVRKLLEKIASESPLVVVFDDIQWGEPTFLDLVEHVADWSRGVPLLLVCMARPDLLDARPHWAGGKVNASTVLLEPLTDEESATLLGNLLGVAGDAPPAVVDRITEAAEGNPLFVEQMLGMLIDRGLLVRSGGAWETTDDLATLAVPPTIQALIAARLDQLSPQERSVLQRASVEGAVFHVGAAVDVAPPDERESVRPSLGTLVRKELIRPDRAQFAGQDAFRFRHQLIRDVSYDSLAKERRADVHVRFAEWLEGIAGGRGPEFDEIIGYHLEQAYRYRVQLRPETDEDRALSQRAAGHLEAAAGRAARRVDFPAARNLWERALALAADDRKKAELQWELGVVLNRMGDYGPALANLSEAIAGAAAAGDVRTESRARVDLWWARMLTGPWSEQMPPEVRELIPTFEATGDDLGLTKAWQLLAEGHYADGRYEVMREPLERAIAHAQRAGDTLEESEARLSLLLVHQWGPTPVPEVIRFAEEAIADGAGDLRTRGQALYVMAHMRATAGAVEEARRALAQGDQIMLDFGLDYARFERAIAHHIVEMLAGDLPDAERLLREVFSPDAPDEGAAVVSSALALVVEAQGRDEEAVRIALQAKDLERDSLWPRAMWRDAMGLALARLGRTDEALLFAREAAALVEASDGLQPRGDVLLRLAQVLRLAGERDEAVSVARQAVDLYDRKGDVVSAGRARALLKEASSG